VSGVSDSKNKGSERQTIDEYVSISGTDELRFERLLPGSIERAWAYLTESDKRGQWLASGEMDLRVGGKVELFFHHNTLSPVHEPVPEKYKAMENGFRMHGTITRIDPPHLLSYTWGDHENSSEVTFELQVRGNDVLLTISHRKLGGREDIVGTSGGWRTHTDVLVDRLNGREPKPFWSTHQANHAAYDRKFPN
jgi:uncharacterized protein YndB with AHSA1/START domain